MPSLRLFLLLLVTAFVSGQSPSPVVRVAHGVLQGSWKVSSKGRTYASFEGIPYARPPVGKYRFREPQQMKPWAGVWDASKPLSICLQYDPLINETVGSENCLFANVFTPKPNAGASLPVLVYIHGGAFMFGAGSIYGSEYLMDWDMVVVTLNYRLGPLGFLSTGDEAAPGNAGLKDQAMALQWVRDNIMMFGGNPDSITLAGCSAGGASVHYHYLSPISRGLFHRGLAFSGSAFAAWTYAVRPAQKARSLATIVGCPNTNNREMVDCLRYRPAEVIVNAQLQMFEWTQNLFTPFRPTTEGPTVRQPFLSQYPFHAAQAGNMNKVPLITSVTSEEGLYPAAAFLRDKTTLSDLDKHWNELASYVFEYNDTLPVSQRASVANSIKQKYLGGKPLTLETFPQLVQALGDRLFAVDVGKLAQIQAASSGQPVYVYRYSFRGAHSLSYLISGSSENYGVSHADDILHIFKYPGLKDFNQSDSEMTTVLIDMLYYYATHGVPKLPTGPQWLPVTPGSPEINYLEISAPNKAEMRKSSDFGLKSFWDNLGLIENEKYQPYIRDEL